MIAVRAEMRGKGVGRRLVEVVTERADEEGMPCYLESSKGMPNLRIYEKLGFEMAREIECVDGKDVCTVSRPSLPLRSITHLMLLFDTDYLAVLYDPKSDQE